MWSTPRRCGDGSPARGCGSRSTPAAERMNAKIRDAQLEKIPYMLVVGDREAAAGAVAVRLRSGQDLGSVGLDDLEERLREEVRARS